MPEAILQFVIELIPHFCKRCMAFMHAKHRPRVKTLMGRFFNHILHCVLFCLLDLIFILVIDECARYKLVAWLKSKSFEDIKEVLLQSMLIQSLTTN